MGQAGRYKVVRGIRLIFIKCFTFTTSPPSTTNKMRLLHVAAALAAGAFAAPHATSKPEQIRSDQDPVFHYYLQAHPKNASQVVLGPVATSEYFNIGGSIQSTNTSRYLNIGGDSTSYKTLTFDAAAATTAWQLEGDTIITSTSSSYGRRRSPPLVTHS